MNNNQIYFPYYSGNIRFSKVQGVISLDKFIDKQKNPSFEMKQIFQMIKQAGENEDKILKRKLKQKLYSFTPSVMIEKGLKRKYENVSYYTGLMQLDFDKIENVDIAQDLKYYLFESSNVVCVYLSPSGLGLKSLFKVQKPKSKAEYKALHKSISNKFSDISYFDPATKNAMLPLFLSYDEDILYRKYNESEPWVDMDFSQPNYESLNTEKPKNYSTNNYYERITVEIFTKKINSISSDGHTQLRSACLIIGSRASAGYIHLDEAISIAESCVKNHNYFQKDLTNYLNTVNWAINQGYKNPKYY